jgi:hypothetical protein
VFADTILQDDQLIGLYQGHLLHSELLPHLRGAGLGSHVIPLLRKNFLLDGLGFATEGFHCGQLVNHGGSGYQNAKFIVCSRREAPCVVFLALKATRTIFAGEEILVDYGKNYWEREFGIRPAIPG